MLETLFRKQDWLRFGPEWLHEHLQRLAAGSYENSTASVVAKLLLRRPPALAPMKVGTPHLASGQEAPSWH